VASSETIEFCGNGEMSRTECRGLVMRRRSFLETIDSLAVTTVCGKDVENVSKSGTI